MREVLLGVTLGWAAGISPGPLTLLVVQAALRSGAMAGALVAVAPLVTDAPIVALSLVVASTVPDIALTALAVSGGIYLIWLGTVEWRSSTEEAGEPGPGSHLRRGVVANALSPHPWVFWLTVGGPTAVDAWDRSVSSAVGFIAAFFVVLVGVKIAIAVAVARAGEKLSEHGRRLAARVGGVALVAVGVIVIAGAI